MRIASAVDSEDRPSIPFAPRVSEPITVFLVDDREIARRGLEAMLSGITDVRVVGSVRTAQEAMDVVLRGVVGVVILPCHLASGDLTSLVAAAGERVRLIGLVLDDSPGNLSVAAGSGLHGFMIESELTVEHIVEATRRVARGELEIPTSLAHHLLSSAREVRRMATSPSRLTPREIEVLALLSDGFSNKRAARVLGISEHAVKRHVGNLLAKLGAPNRAAAVARAARARLILDHSSGEGTKRIRSGVAN